MSLGQLNFEVHEDPLVQTVIRRNPDGGLTVFYEPVPSLAEIVDEDDAEELSPEAEIAARDAAAAEMEERWPDGGWKAVYDAQLAAGRRLLAPRPRVGAARNVIYLRVLGKSASGTDVSAYLEPTRASVSRRALVATAAAFPGTVQNSRGEVHAVYQDVDVVGLLDALFAI